ncbi:hypothetical protein FRC01_000761 [Tulasnella sp. 417]|nr:hypothetical protein FRC01_000761 [Tulasnella sp. 417]
MSRFNLNYSSLESCLQALSYLFIEVGRLTYEQGYDEIVGGYCELKVATLDSGLLGSKLVAAKKLRLGIRASEPKRLAFRLARELKVWAGLRHPHVLPLLGFYLSDDCKTAVLISEYMCHGDLKDYLAKMKPTSSERLLLGNVLVNSERRGLLADFGLSKALDTGPTGFTTGNDARGTVRYSSPEVLLHGTASQSLSDDMWSWGCLVLEALTDKIPFADIQPEPQLILAVVQGQTPGDTNSFSLDAQWLKDLVSGCWLRRPEQRPTAEDCLRALNTSMLVSGADRGNSEHERPGMDPMASIAGGESRLQLTRGESRLQLTSGSSTLQSNAGETNMPKQPSSGGAEGKAGASDSQDGHRIDGFEAHGSGFSVSPSPPSSTQHRPDLIFAVGEKNLAEANLVNDSLSPFSPLDIPLRSEHLRDSGDTKTNVSGANDYLFTFHPPDIPLESEHPRDAISLNRPLPVFGRSFSGVDSVRAPSRFSRRLYTTDGIFERPQWW